MYLNKKKVILVISVSAIVFFLTYTDVKSQNLIFSPLILIVSPSVILRFCDLTSAQVKIKTIAETLITKMTFFLLKYII